MTFPDRLSKGRKEVSVPFATESDIRFQSDLTRREVPAMPGVGPAGPSPRGAILRLARHEPIPSGQVCDANLPDGRSIGR